MTTTRTSGLALFGLLFSGCKLEKSVDTVTLDDNLSSLFIKSDGTITLLPSEDGAVKIEATLYGKNTEFSYEVDDGELTLKKDCRFLHTGRCYVDFLVYAPVDLPAVLEADDDAVEVQGWEAPLEIEVGSGAVSLEEITGDVFIDGSSGAVDGNNLSSDIIEVGLSSGAVALDVIDKGFSSITIETGSGSVDLAVPAAGTYRVETETGSGAVSLNNVNSDSSSQNLISISTGSGSIEITGD